MLKTLKMIAKDRVVIRASSRAHETVNGKSLDSFKPTPRLTSPLFTKCPLAVDRARAATLCGGQCKSSRRTAHLKKCGTWTHAWRG